MSDMIPRPRVRDEFRRKLRADLMNEAVALAEERHLRRRSFAERLRWWVAGPRFRAIAVVASLALVLLAGTGAAAAGSLPGDPAFGIKRAAEEAQLALTPTDAAKVEVLAAQAQHRLDELAHAADRPDKAPTASAAYEAAVARFAAAVEALRAARPGSKNDAVEQVVERARDKHVPVLESLKDRLPADAQQGIERAIEEHDKLAPHGGDRAPKPGERPGVRTPEPARTVAPSRTPGPTRTPEPTRETPRPTETSRGRPSPAPTATR